jgi:CRISPR-associated protein Csb2
MTVALEIRFPWGRYHATAWDRNANEGVPDWPPAPWRILRALYATWQWYCPHLDDTTVLGLLTKLSDNPRFHVPEHTIAHTRHYYPGSAHRPGVSTDTVKTFDTFVAVARNASLIVEYPADLTADEHDALRSLAENLAYLGRAEAIVDADVVTDRDRLPLDGWLEPDPTDLPVSGGVRLLGFEQPLQHGALTSRPSDLRAGRLPQPPHTRWVTYKTPGVGEPVPAPTTRTRRIPTAVRIALSGPALPSLHQAVLVGHVMRRACLNRYGGDSGDVSPILAGKTVDGTRVGGAHRHAHFLTLSTGTNPNLLDTIIVWAPDGLPDRELDAVLSVRRLFAPRHSDELHEPVLGVETVGTIESAAPELCGPAVTWRSLTPFAPTRHARGDRQTTLRTNIERELAYRNKPAPTAVEQLNGPWLQFRRHRPDSETLRHARVAHGVRITFDTPTAGPLALGQLSHFGLGIFRPERPDGS